MAIQDYLSTVKCKFNILGTGQRGCPIDLDNVRNYALSPAGTVITDFSKENLRSLQKEGKWIPLLNGFGTEWSNEENQRETNDATGAMAKGRDGKYMFTASFNTGLYFQKVLKSYEGRGRYDLWLIDDSETVMGTSRNRNGAKGFKIEMFDVNPYTPKAGATTAKTSVTIQLANPDEINKYASWVTADFFNEEGFSILEVDGVNQAEIRVLSGLVAASVSLDLKIYLDMDGYTHVGGLSGENILVRVNGQTVADPTLTEDAAAEKYTLGLGTGNELAVDDKVEILLYNTTENQRVIEVGTSPDEILYQSAEFASVAAAA